VWVADFCGAELQRLARLDWSVFPFVPKLTLASFETDGVDLYLELPGLAPHVLAVFLTEQMTVRSISINT
jgi:hypothetical protein